jgi:hypothetical protein
MPAAKAIEPGLNRVLILSYCYAKPEMLVRRLICR